MFKKNYDVQEEFFKENKREIKKSGNEEDALNREGIVK
jgi:hypothetical protein